MADDDNNFVPYKDISELKKQLEGMQDKKEVSAKELHESVQKLTTAIDDMLDVFGAAAEQLKLEDKSYEAESKKHETIILKLDKLIDQNKTIAEGMVAIVELVKEKFPQKEGISFKSEDADEPMFKQAPAPEPKPAIMPQPDWNIKPSMPRPQPQMPRPLPPMMPPPMPGQNQSQDMDFGNRLPPMEASPLPDLDLPEEPFPFDEEPKKKKLFSMFKK